MGGRGWSRGRGGSAGRINSNMLQQEMGIPRFEPFTHLKQPPPQFPPARCIMAPSKGEKYDYMTVMKGESRLRAQKSPFYFRPVEQKNDIKRYSDKFQQQDLADDWKPDYSCLPFELQPVKTRVRKIKVQIKQVEKTSSASGTVKVNLDELLPEEKEENAEAEEEEEQEEEEEEELVDEEDLDGDYGLDYFDNGEGYDDDGDDGDEGATYFS